jgi:hypothetical protein
LATTPFAVVAAVRAYVGAAKLVRQRATDVAADHPRGLARAVLALLTLGARATTPAAAVVATHFAGAVGLATRRHSDANADDARRLAKVREGLRLPGVALDGGGEAGREVVVAAIGVRRAGKRATDDGVGGADGVSVGNLEAGVAEVWAGVVAGAALPILATRFVAQRATAALQRGATAIGGRTTLHARLRAGPYDAGFALLLEAALPGSAGLAGRASLAAGSFGRPRLAAPVRGATTARAVLRGAGGDALPTRVADQRTRARAAVAAAPVRAAHLAGAVGRAAGDNAKVAAGTLRLARNVDAVDTDGSGEADVPAVGVGVAGGLDFPARAEGLPCS